MTVLNTTPKSESLRGRGFSGLFLRPKQSELSKLNEIQDVKLLVIRVISRLLVAAFVAILLSFLYVALTGDCTVLAVLC